MMDIRYSTACFARNGVIAGIVVLRRTKPPVFACFTKNGYEMGFVVVLNGENFVNSCVLFFLPIFLRQERFRLRCCCYI